MKLMIDNRYQVYLEPKTKLRLEMSMPLPEVDAIPVPMIYPFNIPVARNESIMDYAHLVNPVTRTKVFNVTFYMTDIPVFTGKFYLKNLNEDYYRGSIIFNSFSEGFSEKKLNELVYSDINIGGTPHSSGDVIDHARDVVHEYIEADYTFPTIYAPNFYGEPDDDGLTEYNPDWGGDDGGGGGAVGRYINNYPYSAFLKNNIHEDPTADNVSSLVPCPFVHPLLIKIFQDEGFKSFGAFLDDTELQDLIIFFNYPLDEKFKKYFVDAAGAAEQNISGLYTTLLFPDETEDIDNCWDLHISAYGYEVKNIGYHSFKIDLSAYCQDTDPDCSITLYLSHGLVDADSETIVIEPQTWTDLSFELLAYFGSAEIGNIYYINARFVAGGSVDTGKIKNRTIIASNVSYQNLNQFSNILNIANHLPPVDIGTFVNALKKAFGMTVFFDFQAKEIEFAFIKDILESDSYLDLSTSVLKKNKELEIPEAIGYKLKIDYDRDVFTYDNYEYLGEFATYNDLPTPSEPNKIAIDKSSNTVNIYRKDPDTNSFGWFYYSDNIYEVVTGEGKEEVTAEFSTLACHLGNDLLTAQTKAVASSPAFETGDNDFPLTLLFWRGLQQDANGDDYPMASSVNYNLPGAMIGSYQTKMNGDNGLYEMFLKKWYEFKFDSEEIKRSFLCNTIDFINITKLFLPQRGTIKRKIRVDNMNCLAKKATFILSSAGIEQCEIILLPNTGYNSLRSEAELDYLIDSVDYILVDVDGNYLTA